METGKNKTNPKTEKNKSGRPPLFKTPAEMQRKIDEYFKKCQPEVLKDDDGNIIHNANGSPAYKLNPPTVSGLALFLGFCDRQSLYVYKGYSDDFYDTVKRAITYIAAYAENVLMTGDKVTGAIFWLKNHGWTAEEDRNVEGDITVNDLSKVPQGTLVEMSEAAGLETSGGEDEPNKSAD